MIKKKTCQARPVAASTIATIPARMALGNSGQAATTEARSGGSPGTA
jgi:hypothetical protein